MKKKDSRALGSSRKFAAGFFRAMFPPPLPPTQSLGLRASYPREWATAPERIVRLPVDFNVNPPKFGGIAGKFSGRRVLPDCRGGQPF